MSDMSAKLASDAAKLQYKPGAKAWLCAIGAWLFHLMGCVSLSMMTSIQRAMAEEFAAGDSFRSALTSVFVLGNLILALPMGSFITKHGYRKIGYPEVANLIASHHDLDVEQEPEITEATVLYLADKLIQEDREVSLERRFAASAKRAVSHEAEEAHLRRYHQAQRVAQQIEQQLRGAV